MQLSETVKLYPYTYELSLINEAMNKYINTVNSLVSDAMNGISLSKITSKDVSANLPSAIKNQCIRDAKSIAVKYFKNCHKTVLRNRVSKQPVRAHAVPILKKPCMYINNQNFKMKDNYIEFPVIINGKSKRISIKSSITEKQMKILSNSKLGTMRVIYKNKKLCVQIVYEIVEPSYNNQPNTMGIDLGIKVPAVCYTSNNKVKFVGNGRKNKYLKRFYRYQRTKLLKLKKMKVVKRIEHKESNIFKDIDHKLSSEIIKFAVSNNVSVIKLERLSNIRSTARTSRKNNHSLHSWSFYRLANFIEYKAKLAGIEIIYVNPAYTSQTCPVCGLRNHAKDRLYKCACGYHKHRDLVGAINICNTPMISGNSLSASGALCSA